MNRHNALIMKEISNAIRESYSHGTLSNFYYPRGTLHLLVQHNFTPGRICICGLLFHSHTDFCFYSDRNCC